MEIPDTLSEQRLWEPAFPSAELVSLSSQYLPMRTPWQGHEGPRPQVLISPGCITIRRPDLARHTRTRERHAAARQARVDYEAARYAATGEWTEDAAPTRVITSWSRDSRARMVHTMCQLDYSPMCSDPTRIPAMVTLTYPGDWVTVAPTGRASKDHLRAFQLRYKRAWGEKLTAVWKMEFQDRGAPHYHLLMVPPHGRAGEYRQVTARRRRPAVGDGLHFREWLSATWADVVAHPDPVQRERHQRAGTGVDYAEGMRARDPKRLAVYFLKHSTPSMTSSKEYQHRVPAEWQVEGAGPGRFWGYWHLEVVAHGREVEPHQAVRAARILRRMAAAQGTTREVTVTRHRGGRVVSEVAEVIGLAGAQLVAAHRAYRRRVRRPVRRLAGGAGWVAVRDGAAVGVTLGLALAAWDGVDPLADRQPGRILAAQQRRRAGR